jgi:hypothetical protein
MARIPEERVGGGFPGYTIGNDFGLHDFRDTNMNSMDVCRHLQ